MKITKKTVANKIAAYLHHRISLAQLVSWSEDAMRDGHFEETHASRVAAVVSRLGVADVRGFGLAWEDCEKLLRKLGFVAKVNIVARPGASHGPNAGFSLVSPGNSSGIFRSGGSLSRRHV